MFFDAVVKCTDPADVINVYEGYRDRTPWVQGDDGAWYCRVRSEVPVVGLDIVAEGNDPLQVGNRNVTDTETGATTTVAVMVGIFA